MTQDVTTFEPDWASPPGDTLADLLDERGMTQTELAERLGVTLKHVNRVIKGAATISADLALGLEKVFGTSAAFWMTREAHYCHEWTASTNPEGYGKLDVEGKNARGRTARRAVVS